RLADGLHLGRQGWIGVGKLLERPAWNLGNDVIDGRFETGRRLAGNVVLELVEAVTDGQLGGDLGNRKAGRFRGERAGAADARVHLDDDHAARVGMGGELDVAAAGLDADLADDLEGGVAHTLVFLVGQRLGGGDGDRITGVHPHRVKVFDGADDDDVVGLV